MKKKSASQGEGVDSVLTVFYLDDKVLNLKLAKRILENSGCKVLVESDPQTALKTLLSDNKLFDVFVTDNKMPTMSGSELLGELRRNDVNLPVIICSGYAADFLDNIGSDEKTTFLPKPFEPSELVEAVKRACSGRRTNKQTNDDIGCENPSIVPR